MNRFPPFPCAGHTALWSPTRREFVYSVGASIGSVAFSAMMAEEAQKKTGPLAPKDGHFPAKAKRCIFLMMEGGPSHIDTFDPKPALEKLHLKEFVREDKQQSAMSSGKRYFVRSPFNFRKCGQSGADMCELWENLQDCADDICFYRGCQVDSVNHPTAMYQMNCGNRFGGDPAIGAWTTYGLGTMNQDLPGFIVLPEVSYPQGGSANWSNGYLPASFQGTPLRAKGSPILDLKPPKGITPEHQRENLDLLAKLNSEHMREHPWHDELAARMENYELAFRMQTQVPGILDLSNEKPETLEQYGIGNDRTDAFGRKCLLARKLVEQGVRFVQIFLSSQPWDTHSKNAESLKGLCRRTDQPSAALVQDLKRRGLLDSTIVMWTGEFGRLPISQGADGRDHNRRGFSLWLAGGGFKPGYVHGATDDFGYEAVRDVVTVHDLHATLLTSLGLDHRKLSFPHEGRPTSLTDADVTKAKVVEALFA